MTYLNTSGGYLSTAWSSLAPGVGNHLWQSTLFAIAAALLALLLRKHNARARHWLWMAASLKFLVPFSVLVSLGSRLPFAPAAASPVRPEVYFAVEEISRPFTQIGVSVPASQPSILSTILPQISQGIVAVWLVGFLAVLTVWIARWLRISAVMRRAVTLRDGREVAVLRRVERVGGIRRPIEMLLSQTSLEPGIFGIARPVLVWPEGISKHLDDMHLEAVIAHEVWHVRRRDNLFAALHMLVEAVFWFYPLVWWLGSRLIDERERACDEEVVALGNDRQIYAESILKVCEFCLGSPLPCVSGVTGADLKKRMVHIMNDRILHQLGFAKKLLLTATAFAAVAVPVLFGLLKATPTHAQSQPATATLPASAFASVSIKPYDSADNGPQRSHAMFSLRVGSFSARGITLETLTRMAFHVQDSQISGGPDWINSTKFDIDAKLDDAAAKALGAQGPDVSISDDEVILKSLLANYFKLAAHSEAKNLPAYNLVVDSNGSKLQTQQSQELRMLRMNRGELVSEGVPLELLTQDLSMRLGRTVVDKTGLKGNYAFTLHWTPDPSEDEMFKQHGMPVAPASPAEAGGPDIFTALQEQLGLKLEPVTASVPVLVIDHAEMPIQNQ
jgi:uncharacterized protein (TIGR03435 family)